jgi:DNA-binding transcriptional LysR family regulator
MVRGLRVRITEEGRLYALQIREALQHIADATRMVQIKPRTMELRTPRPWRTNSETPTRASSCLMCWLTAEWVTLISH